MIPFGVLSSSQAAALAAREITGAQTLAKLTQTSAFTVTSAGSRSVSGAQTLAKPSHTSEIDVALALTGAQTLGKPTQTSALATAPAGQTAENLILFPTALDDASWTKSATVTPNTHLAPDGTMAADTLTATSVSTMGANRNFTTTVAGTHFYSAYFHKSATTSPWMRMALSGVQGAGATALNFYFDLVNGVIGSKEGTGTSHGIIDEGDYWRLWVSAPMAIGTGIVYIRLSTANSNFNSAAGHTAIIWGLMLTAGETLLPFYTPVGDPARNITGAQTLPQPTQTSTLKAALLASASQLLAMPTQTSSFATTPLVADRPLVVEDIAGVAWFDMKDDAALTMNGSNIASVASKGVTGRTLSFPVQPAKVVSSDVNGRQAARFTGTQYGVVTTADQPKTIIVSLKVKARDIGRTVWCAPGGSLGNFSLYTTAAAAADGVDVYDSTYTNGYGIYPNGSGDIVTIVFRKGPASGSLWKNGTRTNNGAADLNTGTSNKIALGAYWQGSWAPDLIADVTGWGYSTTNLSDSDVEKIVGSLNWGDGSQSTLPSGFPFKDAPPMVAGSAMAARTVTGSQTLLKATQTSSIVLPTSTTSLTRTIDASIGGKPEVKRALMARHGFWSHTPTKKFPWPLYGGRWWKNDIATNDFDPVRLTDNDAAGDVFEWEEIVTNEEGTASFKTPSVTLAAYSATDIDVATIGCKPASTTGTISSGNLSLLTVANAADFTTGDTIVIEIGGEAGAGMRKTKGVGGTWPPLGFASVAAMNADKSQPNNTFAYVDDANGYTYRYNSTTQVWGQWGQYDYYWGYYRPIALVTTITKNGNQLTLATPASVPVTNANIYLSNSHKMNAATTFGSNKTYKFGPGTFALGSNMNMCPNGNNDYTLQGAGKDGSGNHQTIFYIPKGLGIVAMSANGGFAARRTRFRDFKVHGNAGDNGFSFAYANSISIGQPGPAVYMEAMLEGMVTNVESYENFQGPSFSRDTNCWGVGLKCRMITAHRRYFQWQIIMSDCDRGGQIDPWVDSDWMVPGIEFFSCYHPMYIRPVSRNAGLSTNSSGLWSFINPKIHIEAYRNFPGDWTQAQAGSGFLVNFTPDSPLIDCNTNVANSDGPGGTRAGNATLGGHIVNMEYIVDGPATANKRYNKNILISPNYVLPDGVTPSVSIHGGFMKIPDYETTLNGDTGNQSRWAISGDGPISVWNLIITGKPPQASWGYSISGQGACLIQDNVVWPNLQYGSGSTVSGNITPTEYVAQGGVLP